MASLYQPVWTRLDLTTGLRVKHRVRIWWGQWRDAAGVVRRESLKTTNKAAAQLKLADHVRDAQAGRDGLPRTDRRTVSEHADDWEAALTARGVSAAHTKLLLYRVRRAIADCRWVTLASMNARTAEPWLATITGPTGVSPKTRNDYVDSLRSFASWLVRERRLREDDRPFAALRHVKISTDRRHDRRPLTEVELGRLLAAAEASAKAWRGLTGTDRHALYLTAMSTGFRAGELASLTPCAFALEETPPVVRLAAAHAKNRRSAVQPIPVDVVPMLAAYLARRAPDQPVWPGTWTQDASQMIRHDLEAAGIPYVVQTPDWPLYADMHALRHSFIAMLDKPGVTLKQAMQLARHSDPRLTMKIYGRAALADLAAAVDGAFGGFATPPDDPSPATIPFRVAK